MIQLTNVDGLAKKTIEVKDILGQKVVDSNNADVGRIYGLRFDLKNLVFQGIIANKGLFASDFYIGKDYIDQLNEDGAILNIIPLDEFVGKDVFDSKTIKIGTVKSVQTVDVANDMFSMIVENGSTDTNVYEYMIEKIGDSVVLKKPVE